MGLEKRFEIWMWRDAVFSIRSENVIRSVERPSSKDFREQRSG
jgi:hypothetical protein